MENWNLKFEKWHKHQLEPITKAKEARIRSDTDWKIKTARPAKVINVNQRKTCLLIDMALPTGNNVSVK